MKFHISIVQARHESPLGPILLAATQHGLAGLWFEEGQRHMPDRSSWPHDPKHPVLERTREQLDQYFAGSRTTFDLPLDLQSGTEFQQSVGTALMSISWGSTTSYGAIGQRIGRPAAHRAVGVAVGRNPVSIIVPCHRVIGAGGGLTGYAGGLDRKTALLRLEAPVSALEFGTLNT